MYIYGTLLLVFTLGVPKAYSYFLPRVELEEAKDLISKINRILIAAGLLMAIVLFTGSGTIANFLGNEELLLSLKYFSLVPVFLLPTMGIESVLSVYKKGKQIAIYNFVTKMFTFLCVITPVLFFNGTANEAILGFTVASFVSFLIAMYFKYWPLKNRSVSKSPISYREILTYTSPIMMASIWGVVINSADQFFISKYFGVELFAEFSNGSLELPFVGMIVSASSLILAPIYSKKAFENTSFSKKEIIRLWNSVFNKTVKLIYPLVIFCFTFATSIMVILYGEDYSRSGDFFQVKLINNFFTLISYGPLLLAIGGQKYYRNIHIIAALVLVLLEFLIVFFLPSAILIVVASVTCRILRIIAMLLYISNYFEISLTKLIPFKLIFKIVVPAFLLSFLAKYVLFYVVGLKSYFLLIGSGVLYGVTYAIWAYLAKIDYWSIIEPLYSSRFKRR